MSGSVRYRLISTPRCDSNNAATVIRSSTSVRWSLTVTITGPPWPSNAVRPRPARRSTARAKTGTGATCCRCRWADFVGGLTFSADASIVIRADAGVDVLSDNTCHLAVLPSATSPQHHERTHTARTPGHRQARRIVRDNIDTIDHCSDDRVMQKTSWHCICQDGDVEPGEGWWYW